MPNDLVRIRSVSAMSPTVLRVTWADHRTDPVDLAGWIARGGDLLAALSSPEIFAQARVGDYGASLEWGGEDSDLAIDAHHLRQIAEAQRAFGSRDLAEWQASIGFSNQEAASFLGIALSTFNGYKAGSPIPVRIGMLCRAALRDPLLIDAHFRPRAPGRPRNATLAG